MVDWNVYGLAFVPEAVALAALAGVIYRARPSSSQNQSLALVFASLAAMTSGLIVGYMSEEPGNAKGGFAVLYASWFMHLVAQFRFAASLEVPWLRFLQHRWSDRAILGAYILGPLIVVLWILPVMFTHVTPYRPFVPWRPLYFPGAFETWSYVVAGMSLVVLLAAAHAWRRAPPGSGLRATMATYFAAALLIEGIQLTTTALRADIVHRLQAGGTVADWKVPTFLLSAVLSQFAYVAGLGYAILKAQVFDIDLKIKLTIRRGTVVATFVGVFFVIAEVAQNYLAGAFGWLAGGFAAGTLLLALRPLERAAGRLADRAMPRTRDTVEYRTVRKREVYRAAVESALVDGEITPKERGMLATLAEQLGLGPKQMHDLERDARATRAGVVA